MKGMRLSELDLHLQFLHPLELHNQSFEETCLLNKQLDSHIYFVALVEHSRTLQPHTHQLKSKLHLKARRKCLPNSSHVV